MTALTDQANKLWHTTNIYMHPKIHEYAEKLISKMPGDLKVIKPVETGFHRTFVSVEHLHIVAGCVFCKQWL